MTNSNVPSAPPILAVENLQVRFRVGQQELRAVDGVSFAIAEGETFGVIGESGSGKSTLGRVVTCLTRPNGGQVLHSGSDPFALRQAALRRHRRGYQIIFQDPDAALDPRMTALESVCEPVEIIREGSRADRRSTALALLDRVGLTAEQGGRYPHELSGGQKQRVNIARALTLTPRFIVCDEVVAALDVSIQADMLNLFLDLQRERGLTYMFITHDIGVVAHISDRIAVMYLGKLVELGPAGSVADTPLHPYTQALLSAEPEPLPAELRRHGRTILQGEIPSPLAPPSGCRFRTRCPMAKPRCEQEAPAWRRFREGHYAACHFIESGKTGRAQ